MGAGQDYRKQECSHMQDVTDRHEVMVVGGGQAGLAMGYFLAQHGHDFVILEAADETAAAWLKRWDSLGLYFLGLTWQYTRGSALIGWVQDDAEYLAQRIDELGATAPSTPTSSKNVRASQLIAASTSGET